MLEMGITFNEWCGIRVTCLLKDHMHNSANSVTSQAMWSRRENKHY
jgi:hypothetical protein